MLSCTVRFGAARYGRDATAGRNRKEDGQKTWSDGETCDPADGAPGCSFTAAAKGTEHVAGELLWCVTGSPTVRVQGMYGSSSLALLRSAHQNYQHSHAPSYALLLPGGQRQNGTSVMCLCNPLSVAEEENPCPSPATALPEHGDRQVLARLTSDEHVEARVYDPSVSVTSVQPRFPQRPGKRNSASLRMRTHYTSKRLPFTRQRSTGCN